MANAYTHTKCFATSLHLSLVQILPNLFGFVVISLKSAKWRHRLLVVCRRTVLRSCWVLTGVVCCCLCFSFYRSAWPSSVCCCLCFSFYRSAWPSSVDILSLKLMRSRCISAVRRCCAGLLSNLILTISAFRCVTGFTPCGTIHIHHCWSAWQHSTRQNSAFIGLVYLPAV